MDRKIAARFACDAKHIVPARMFRVDKRLINRTHWHHLRFKSIMASRHLIKSSPIKNAKLVAVMHILKSFLTSKTSLVFVFT